jgi:hypothetical protein
LNSVNNDVIEDMLAVNDKALLIDNVGAVQQLSRQFTRWKGGCLAVLALMIVAAITFGLVLDIGKRAPAGPLIPKLIGNWEGNGWSVEFQNQNHTITMLALPPDQTVGYVIAF